jgi:catechol 2,3-dioxygenase-like lactoylglutathione lyase family enzyme
MIEGISAVTLGTDEMPRAVRFYCALGFEVLHGNEQVRDYRAAIAQAVSQLRSRRRQRSLLGLAEPGKRARASLICAARNLKNSDDGQSAF